MKIVLTGANSFLGHHILKYLSATDFDVTATYRTDSNDLKSMAPQADFVQLDLGSMNNFVRLPKSVDAIVHVAGVSMAQGISMDEMIRCNVDGNRNLLRYAKISGAKCIIYASTLSIHGDIDVDEVTELTPVRSPDLYGTTKFLGERIFASASADLSVAAIRLPGILGKGAHRAWIPRLLEDILNDREIVAFNPETSFNNAADVKDLSALIVDMLSRDWTGFHAFPVGASGTMKLRDVISRISTAADRMVQVKFVPTKRRSFTLSSNYASSVFGYKPTEIGAMLDRYVADATDSNGQAIGENI